MIKIYNVIIRTIVCPNSSNKNNNNNHISKMRPDQVDLVLYHGNCADGFGARCAAQMRLGSEAQYLPMSHGSKEVPDVTGKYVAILDFSFPYAQLVEMIRNAAGLIVIDHHHTAQVDLANIPEQNKIFDMHQSGAVLAWKYFFPGQTVPLLLRYVQDRDIWTWQLPKSMEVCAGLDMFPQTTEVWYPWFHDEYKLFDDLEGPGKSIVAYRNQLIDSILKKSVTRTICRVPTRCVNATGGELLSYLGHRMLEKYPDVQMALMYCHDPERNRYAVSLRSRGDFDCSVVAKRFGGGGHKQACGFDIPTSQDILKTLE